MNARASSLSAPAAVHGPWSATLRMLATRVQTPMTVASSFVGRSTELDRLGEALEALERGEPRAGQVIGPAGIGKARLLTELAGRAEDRGHIVLSGTGAELEQDLPFWVFVDALDEYVEGI